MGRPSKNDNYELESFVNDGITIGIEYDCDEDDDEYEDDED